MDIVMSYAHFPKKPGAGYDGFYEHWESIKWTDIIIENLEFKGLEVGKAPIGGLFHKVNYINSCKPLLAVEIHFNGSANPKVHGCETLYCPGSKKGERAAKIVHSNYASAMGNRDRGIKEGWYRMDVPGVEDYPGDVEGDEIPDYFLRKTRCVALILEPEFIARKENIVNKREEACEKISLGLYTAVQYLKSL